MSMLLILCTDVPHTRQDLFDVRASVFLHPASDCANFFIGTFLRVSHAYSLSRFRAILFLHASLSISLHNSLPLSFVLETYWPEGVTE